MPFLLQKSPPPDGHGTYEAKYGEKAVRKNLTILAWLNNFAEKIISIFLNFYKIPYSKWHKLSKYRELPIGQLLLDIRCTIFI